MKLLRSNRPVGTIFDLLGSKEDDMTYSLGYVMAKSPAFAQRLVEQVAGVCISWTDDATVRLQTVDANGRTDVEIHVGNAFFAVIEAKRGPQLPTEAQLLKYVPRVKKAGAAVMRLATVSNVPELHAATRLPKTLGGIPVEHLSWRTIKRLAEGARADETHENKRLIDEFTRYLQGILGMERSRSNMVYVVSLGAGDAWGVNFRKVVEVDRRYFYPVKGGGWPEPPNYIAFRWDNQLQAIHHVEGHEIFTNPKPLFPEAKSQKVVPHYSLKLGPPIRPNKKVPNGPSILRAARVWCTIDTLLTAESITAALAQTKLRQGGDAASEDKDE